jgi:hypothetical protein
MCDHFTYVQNIHSSISSVLPFDCFFSYCTFNAAYSISSIEAEGKEQYRVEVSNRFAALEDLDAEVEINSAWEEIRENIKI